MLMLINKINKNTKNYVIQYVIIVFTTPHALFF